jgi:hypothetical protein
MSIASLGLTRGTGNPTRGAAGNCGSPGIAPGRVVGRFEQLNTEDLMQRERNKTPGRMVRFPDATWELGSELWKWGRCELPDPESAPVPEQRTGFDISRMRRRVERTMEVAHA